MPLPKPFRGTRVGLGDPTQKCLRFVGVGPHRFEWCRGVSNQYNGPKKRG
jgi:hypothetical protein